jgi:adenylate cyclase
MAEARVERRLAAILAADVAGYSRLMGADEVGTLAALKALRREIVDPAIAEHHGRIVKTTGDGMLVEFASAVDAVNCAVGVQAKMAECNSGDLSQQITFRIGINVGDIIIEGDDIFGDGVNVAARVENECEPGSVYLSGGGFEHVRGKINFAFDDLGERALKNIDRPVRLYAVRTGTAVAAASAGLSAETHKPPPYPTKLRSQFSRFRTCLATLNRNTSRTEWLRRSSRRSRGSNLSVETETIQLQPGDDRQAR